MNGSLDSDQLVQLVNSYVKAKNAVDELDDARGVMTPLETDTLMFKLRKLRDSMYDMSWLLHDEKSRLRFIASHARQEYRPWSNRKYAPNPDTLDAVTRSDCIKLFKALTGDYPRSLGMRFNRNDVQCLFKSSAMRRDKNFVVLDIETASPPDLPLDSVFSYVIEVGYVVYSVEHGELDRYSQLFSPPERFMEQFGTGAVNIHGISTSDVIDRPQFSRDNAAVKTITDSLQGHVLVAHNAPFEVSQLSLSMPGFARMIASGDIEVLDTCDLCRYCIDSKRNTNQAFVEATGGVYRNAHRALSDAVMTCNALLRAMSLDEVID